MTFTLFGMTIYAYGLLVAAAALLSLLLAVPLCKKLKAGTLSWFALLAVPLCVLFARLGYCLIRFGWFTQKGLGWFFCFTDGGFVLYGALAGGFLAALLTAKLTRQSFGRICDALAAPAALLIALCRLAEGVVGEGYGWDMEEWFTEEGWSIFRLEDPEGLWFFPLGIQDSYETWCWAVFVLEALFALVVCVWLLKSRSRFPGDKGLLLLLLYSAGQATFESMRQDSVLKWGFVRASQILSAILVAFVLVMYWRYLPRDAARVKRMVTSGVGTLCCMLLVIAMEFGVEKKIVFLEWLPVDMCYLIMALACAGLLAFILPVRKHTEAKRLMSSKVAI